MPGKRNAQPKDASSATIGCEAKLWLAADITTDGQAIDVFTAAGLPTPDIGILDDRFLAEMRGLKHKNVAAELITKVRQSLTIDWTLRESARAQIKVLVKRILNKYGYPPDLQEEAVKAVLMQAESLRAEWV